MTQLSKKPKRRWLRFSLRTSLIVFTVFCAWFGWYLYQVEQQRAAVKWVLANGGTVYYDEEFDENGFNVNGQPAVPRWLLDLLGVDYFSTVTQVIAVNKDIDITPLLALTNLRTLILSDTQANHIAPLAGLSGLEELWLGTSQVSNEDFERLKKALPNCNMRK